MFESIIELIFILFLKNEAEQVLNYKFKLLVSILIKELFYSIFNFIRKIVWSYDPIQMIKMNCGSALSVP